MAQYYHCPPRNTLDPGHVFISQKERRKPKSHWLHNTHIHLPILWWINDTQTHTQRWLVQWLD